MQNLAWQIFPLFGANLKLLSNVECTFVDLDIVDLKNAKASAYPPLTGFQKLFDGPKRSNTERIVTKFAKSTFSTRRLVSADNQSPVC